MGEEPTTAIDWFNVEVLSRLSFEQDYDIVDSKISKTETGIKVNREHVRLYSTGIDKLHRMIVLHEELPIINDPEEDK